jgi:small subunit ribosomal protein S6
VQSRLSETISKHDGEIIRSEKWKERDLAYRIGEYKKGIYYLLIYRSLPNAVNEMEKNLRFFNIDVLRFITLNIDEDEALRGGDSSKTNDNWVYKRQGKTRGFLQRRRCKFVQSR